MKRRLLVAAVTLLAVVVLQAVNDLYAVNAQTVPSCKEACDRKATKCREEATGVYVTCGQQGGTQEECEKKRRAYLATCGCERCSRAIPGPGGFPVAFKTWWCECGEPYGEDGCGYSEDGTVNYCDNSPVVIDVQGNGFNLTDAAAGVNFDLRAIGIPIRTAWTEAYSDDAWLVLDRNGDGMINDGSELFGNFTPQPDAPNKNGFLALAEYDKTASGGNSDGQITQADAIFPLLNLWQDINHNGVSESAELHSLSSLGVRSISLDYKEARRRDRFGNEFRYRAKVNDTRWAYDVFLRTQ